MSYLPAVAIILLMLGTGMSLDLSKILAFWRSLTAAKWRSLILVTFIIPPVCALLLSRTLHLDRTETAALFLISIAPGAPLMTRNAAQHGFDLEVAAFYQVWGALMAPLAIPLLVGCAAKLHGRDVWIPPLEVAVVMAEKQLLPLLAGMVLRRVAPGFSTAIRRPLNLAGNLILTVVLLWLLWKLGPDLASVTIWLVVAVFALAIICLASARWIIPGIPTIAVSNVNRHVGLALLLSGRHVQNPTHAIPTLACYALAAPLVMVVFARWKRAHSGNSSVNPGGISS